MTASSADVHSRAHYWHRQISSTELVGNFGHFCDLFVPVVAGWGIVFAGILLAVRKWEGSVTIFTNLALLWLIGAAAVALWLQRKKMIRRKDAVVLLDEKLKFNGLLVSAWDGVAPWPKPRAVGRVFRWQGRQFAAPVILALLAPLAAWMIPLKGVHVAAKATQIPPSLQQVEQWLEYLKKTDEIQPEALEELQRQCDALNKSSPEDWYKQANLEASDNLKEQMNGSLHDMRQDLAAMQDALQKMLDQPQMGAAEAKELGTQISKTMEGLQSGMLPMNEASLREMKAMDLSKSKNISQADLAKMQAKMAAASDALSKMPGLNESNCPGISGFYQVHGDHPGGKGGGGPAPLAFSEDESVTGGTRKEGSSNMDTRNAALGDKVGETIGKHDKPAAAATVEGGGIASPGTGGETAWRQELDLEEQKVVEKYFQ